ncbi:MAG: UDP-N-acetylglucosamine 1-carboxyvinyltransferase [Oligoflexales bacterium]|nr:UDP-N-acetylglucosamine 1-carboxyvinyltransferase [Oligoflexales bacterium]
MSRFMIEGGRALSGTVKPSGNKNEALPALMSCLLTDEPIVLHRIPQIKDVLTTCHILEGIGVQVDWINEDSVRLCAKQAHSYKPDPELCSHVRASILLLGGLLSRFGKIELPLPGGDVIGARRIDTHFEVVQALGGTLQFDHVITGQIEKIQGTDVYLDEPSVTATENAILLAVLCEGKTTLYNAACEPHVNGLCQLLKSMGAKIEGIGSNQLKITGVPALHGTEYTIGPDYLEIGSFLCLGAIAGGKVEIESVPLHDMRFILKTLSRIGINPTITVESASDQEATGRLSIDGSNPIKMQTDISRRIGTVYSGPWPAFSSDLMSVAIVAATQAEGTLIFHEKMYEGRMFFTDKLMAMGANIVLCDPHRVVVTGSCPLSSSRISSPDVRAGMALLMAALIAKGTSLIGNIYQIERGYYQVEKKLQALGAAITRMPS